MTAQAVNVKLSVDSKLGRKEAKLKPSEDIVGDNGEKSVKKLPPLKYPFHKVTNEILQFPRRQLYFQNSTIAILVADPNRHIEVAMTKIERPKTTTEDEPDSSSMDHSTDGPLVFMPLNATVKPPKEPVKKQTRTRTPKRKSTKIGKKKSDIELSVNVKHACKDHHNNDTIKVELQEEPQDDNLKLTGLCLVDLNHSRDFLLLDVDQVCSILSSNHLDVSNETMVFRFAMRWLKFDIEERKIHAEKVLQCVRFGLIKPRDSVKCHAKCLDMGFLECPSLCVHLYCGVLWSTAKRYGLEYLIPQMKPESRNVKKNMEPEIPRSEGAHV